MKLYTVGLKDENRVVFPGATFRLKQSFKSGFFIETGSSTIGISNELMVSRHALVTIEPECEHPYTFLTLTNASVEQGNYRETVLIPPVDVAQDSVEPESVLIWVPDGNAEISQLHEARVLSDQLLRLSANGTFLVTRYKPVGSSMSKSRRIVENEFEVGFNGKDFFIDGHKQYRELIWA